MEEDLLPATPRKRYQGVMVMASWKGASQYKVHFKHRGRDRVTTFWTPAGVKEGVVMNLNGMLEVRGQALIDRFELAIKQAQEAIEDEIRLR